MEKKKNDNNTISKTEQKKEKTTLSTKKQSDKSNKKDNSPTSTNKTKNTLSEGKSNKKTKKKDINETQTFSILEEIEKIKEQEKIATQINTKDIEEFDKNKTIILTPITDKIEQLTKKKYFGYNTRITSSIILFVILLLLSFILIITSFSKVNEQTVDYNENSNADYKVMLKNNSFYEEKYLGKDRAYVSTLIDYIDTSFTYNFIINEFSNLGFEYEIVGKLMIVDANNSKVFFDKEYQLTDLKQKYYSKTKNVTLSENVKIDYNYYNNIANEFRQSYGINTQSYFQITLNVKAKEMNQKFQIDEMYSRSIKIPLGQREVNITIDDETASNVHKVISKNQLLISNKFYIIIAVVAFILAIFTLIKLVTTLSWVVIPKKTKYDKYISKILKEYDRLIVNTSTPPDITSPRIVKIDQFEELLDVRDNLKLPIKYYIVTEHQKCIFYITHDQELYLLTIKAVDLEK